MPVAFALETTHFGCLTIQEEKIMTFPMGLVGLAQATRFILMEVPEWQGELQWLQSVDQGDLAFVLINPAVCRPDYQPTVSPEVLGLLGLDNMDSAIVMAICTVPEDPLKMTANLLAPLIINPLNQTGLQVVLSEDSHPLRCPVFKEQAAAEIGF